MHLNDINGESPNKGVRCDVSNCVYHNGRDACVAKIISVGPGYVNSTDETICSTFKKKEH